MDVHTTASLQDSPRSRTDFRNAVSDHGSCSSLSFQSSFASIDLDGTYTFERNHDQQESTYCDERHHQDNGEVVLTRLISDFEQIAATSMPSVKTEGYESYDSIHVTRRRIANKFTLTLEPESSSDDGNRIDEFQPNGAEETE